MKTISSVLILLFVLIASVHSYDVLEDEEGGQFYLVPIHRVRRQSTVDIRKDGPGTRVTLGHSGTIFQNGDHKVNGGGFVSQPFHPKGPSTLGGHVNYNHVPSGSNLGVNVAKTGKFGTDVGVQGTANLWQRGNSRLDAVGSYDRHFGGIGGTGRPQSYGGINFNHKF